MVATAGHPGDRTVEERHESDARSEPDVGPDREASSQVRPSPGKRARRPARRHRADPPPSATTLLKAMAPALFNAEHRHALHQLVLVQLAVILVVVLTTLPFVFGSMRAELTQSEENTLFEFPGGQPVGEAHVDVDMQPHTYFNIAAVSLDESLGSVTLALSGHRVCPSTCPDVIIQLVSLNDDAHHRRALPPSATIELDPDATTFTQTIELPLQGEPSLYPFDSYTLWLGLAGTVEEDEERVQLTADLVAGQAMVTTQDQLRDFDLAQPVAIDPQRVQADTDPFDFFGVQELQFDRPVHLKILTAVLLSLIAASAIIAVAMRDIRDLVFGIGSLIIAIWGIRSVLMPESLDVSTSIDFALLIIILLVLLGLTARAAWSFSRPDDVPTILRRWHERLRFPRGANSLPAPSAGGGEAVRGQSD